MITCSVTNAQQLVDNQLSGRPNCLEKMYLMAILCKNIIEKILKLHLQIDYHL